MTELFVVGGQQKARANREPTEEWHAFQRAMIVAVDPATGTGREVASWVSRPDACPDDDPSIVFKAATLDAAGGRLYACTQTELVTYEFPSFRPVGYLSLPCFNDVHHVTPGPGGTLVVANTGLDMVLELAPDGRVLREWAVDGQPLWSRFSRDVDYRKVLTTKPHVSHPNFVFFDQGELWVNRCFQSEIACLTAPAAVAVGDRWIHDAARHGDVVAFTLVDGRIAEVDMRTRTTRRMHDLTGLRGGVPVGWCRGLEALGDGLFVVGFSRLRPTKVQEALKWVKRGLGGSGYGLAPTRITAYDPARGAAVWEFDLEPLGMNVVFSVHAADPAAIAAVLRAR